MVDLRDEGYWQHRRVILSAAKDLLNALCRNCGTPLKTWNAVFKSKCTNKEPIREWQTSLDTFPL